MMASRRKRYGRTASGKAITDDLVEQLAAKAQQGYDVEDTLRRRAGRPRLGRGRASVESVRLDPELRDALHAHAEREHQTTSSIVREALREYLKVR
jgi:hypothetical protein